MDTNELKSLAEAAGLVDWKWWTSNSVLRLTTEREGRHGADGDAISAYHDNVQCPEAYRAFIEKASPAAVGELIAKIDRLEAALRSPDEITAEPASDYAALRKQFLALRILANSMSRQVSHWRNQCGTETRETLLANADNVNAERNTNQMLTDALLAAEDERDALKVESKRLAKKIDHSEYWYGTRFETLFHWAHRELNEQQKNQYFSIVANGSSAPDDPPTYAQQMNQLKWKVEAAEKERDMLKAELEALRKEAANGQAT